MGKGTGIFLELAGAELAHILDALDGPGAHVC